MRVEIESEGDFFSLMLESEIDGTKINGTLKRYYASWRLRFEEGRDPDFIVGYRKRWQDALRDALVHMEETLIARGLSGEKP